jgi:hypothetical protein
LMRDMVISSRKFVYRPAASGRGLGRGRGRVTRITFYLLLLARKVGFNIEA